MKSAPVANAQTAYDDDYCQWIDEQVALLRRGEILRVDVRNVAEQLEDIAKREKSAVESNLRIVLAYLLKHQFQPEKRSGSWEATIIEHRARIRGDLKASPCLRPYAAEALPASYKSARRLAAAETRLPIATFPDTCPYTLVQVLDDDFLPD